MSTALNQLKEILHYAQIGSKNSSFYTDIWGTEVIEVKKIDDLRAIPAFTYEQLSGTDFPERNFTNEQVFLKLISTYPQPFVVGKTLKNISSESLHIKGERPLILFERMGESIEWGLSCYEHNILPLAAELNNKLSVLSAGRYRIDTIICDSVSLGAYHNLLAEYCDINSIAEIHILDTHFDPSLEEVFPHSSFVYHLTLPECGIVAETTNPHSTWKAVDTVILESLDEHLVTTSLSTLPTPLIRYQTSITVQPAGERNTPLTEFSLTDDT